MTTVYAVVDYKIRKIRAYVEDRDPKIAGGMVLAFDIQPNQL